MIAPYDDDTALDAHDAFFAVVLIALGPRRTAGGNGRDEHLEVAPRLGREHFDPDRAAVHDTHARAFANDVGSRIVLDHEIRHRGVQRTREIAQGRERGGGVLVFDLADEPLRKTAQLCELLDRETSTESQFTDLLTELHVPPPQGFRRVEADVQ